MKALHILLADDHCLFRKGVMAALKELRPHWLFTEAENGQQVVQHLSSDSTIHIVLLDISMPLMDGVEASKQIKKIHPELPVIILTQFDDNSLILHLLQLGINGFLLKNTDPQKVVEAIEMVMHNGKFISDQVARALETSVGMIPENKVRLDLSVRDKEIIHFLCLGMSTKEIADRMHLSETSVESYRKDLLHKTRTHNVAELISFAHRTGILSLHSENRVS